MDRLIEQINFDGRPQRYAYDAAGQLIESEDAGQRSAYQYDLAGRLLTRTVRGNWGRITILPKGTVPMIGS